MRFVVEILGVKVAEDWTDGLKVFSNEVIETPWRTGFSKTEDPNCVIDDVVVIPFSLVLFVRERVDHRLEIGTVPIFILELFKDKQNRKKEVLGIGKDE